MGIIKKAVHYAHLCMVFLMGLLSGAMSLQSAQSKSQTHAIPITIQVKEIKDEKGNVINYDPQVTQIAYPKLLHYSEMLQNMIGDVQNTFIEKARKKEASEKNLEKTIRQRIGLPLLTMHDSINVLVSPAILALLETVITAFTKALPDLAAAKQSVQTIPMRHLLELINAYDYFEITIPALYNALFERLIINIRQHLRDKKVDLRRLLGYANNNEAELAANLSALFKGGDIRLIRISLEKVAFQPFILLRTLSGHIRGITSVSYSPDGRHVASGALDHTIKIWDATTGQQGPTLQGHTDGIGSVAYSPDGQSIASSAWDDTIKIWNTTTGQLRQTLQGHTGGIGSVAYSPDGQSIASGSTDSTIKIWSIATGQSIQTLQGHAGTINSVAYSPDGRHIASGADDNTIKIWDAVTGQLRQTLQGHTGGISSVAYSPDGQSIASGAGDNTIKIWDAITGQLQQTLQGHTGFVSSVVYSPDGKNIASGSSDNTIKIWSVAMGRLRQTLPGHAGVVSSVAYSPDGKNIASGSWDRVIAIWQQESLKNLSLKALIDHIYAHLE